MIGHLQADEMDAVEHTAEAEKEPIAQEQPEKSKSKAVDKNLAQYLFYAAIYSPVHALKYQGASSGAPLSQKSMFRVSPTPIASINILTHLGRILQCLSRRHPMTVTSSYIVKFGGLPFRWLQMENWI